MSFDILFFSIISWLRPAALALVCVRLCQSVHVAPAAWRRLFFSPSLAWVPRHSQPVEEITSEPGTAQPSQAFSHLLWQLGAQDLMPLCTCFAIVLTGSSVIGPSQVVAHHSCLWLPAAAGHGRGPITAGRCLEEWTACKDPGQQGRDSQKTTKKHHILSVSLSLSLFVSLYDTHDCYLC